MLPADIEPTTAEADAAIAADKINQKKKFSLNLTEHVETSAVETSRGEVEALKQAYYKIRRNEVGRAQRNSS